MTSRQCLAVLVVEDDADIREAVATALDLEGFRVFQADNGAHALELLPSMPHPSLILADLMMPVMNGWQLIGVLSRDDRFATLPVVLVSALDGQAPAGYRQVKKPIDIEDLTKIVGELCIRRS
jgi:CheY-like chemotaxis protein